MGFTGIVATFDGISYKGWNTRYTGVSPVETEGCRGTYLERRYVLLKVEKLHRGCDCKCLRREKDLTEGML